ncbi:MAG: murein peptide amidase A [Calditrichaeota bacterium]|nr:murein peptide amidase A [Calditrichota bacterium]
MKLFKYTLYILITVWLVYKYAMPYFKTFNSKSEATEMYNSIPSDGLSWSTFAHSTLGNSIYLKEFGDAQNGTLIFGAFHGDEPGGFMLVTKLARYIQKNPDEITQGVVIVPVLNPDGLLSGTRTNSNGVDVNRNFPTENWSPAYNSERNFPGEKPASEIETVIAMQLIDKYKPAKIISVHSALHVINYDGPALGLANEMARYNNYKVSEDIGYSTPGSFGTYAGIELKIPTITLELPTYDPVTAWKDNGEALIKAINY